MACEEVFIGHVGAVGSKFCACGDLSCRVRCGVGRENPVLQRFDEVGGDWRFHDFRGKVRRSFSSLGVIVVIVVYFLDCCVCEAEIHLCSYDYSVSFVFT